MHGLFDGLWDHIFRELWKVGLNVLKGPGKWGQGPCGSGREKALLHTTFVCVRLCMSHGTAIQMCTIDWMFVCACASARVCVLARPFALFCFVFDFIRWQAACMANFDYELSRFTYFPVISHPTTAIDVFTLCSLMNTRTLTPGCTHKMLTK